MEGKIYPAILGVMEDVGAIEKEQYNSQQRFRYRGVDDVMNALHPSMTKHRIFVAPEVMEQEREERSSAKGNNLIYSICKIRFRFYAEDGSYIDAVTVGEGMDSGDKATNKAMAIAFKYACFQVFCIPTDEMKDPDGESHEVRGKGVEVKPGKTSVSQENMPVSRGDEPGRRGTVPERREGMPDLNGDVPVTQAMINSLAEELKRTGIGLRSLLASYGIEQISQMTVEAYKSAMNILQKKPDRPVPPPAPREVIPEEVPEEMGLPFR